ncbi:hypothetical protein MU582_16955 [Nocardioidaceae bacterium SCSIO 66511]|nr:hypothetical protein MU582_16955 [Nocardioidaceae bacterium SCSIO 66511]
MNSMTVRHSKPLAIAALVVGVLLLATSLIGPQWFGVFAGAVLTLLGALQLINPMLRIEPGEVRMCNALGMTVKRFPVSSPADLALDGKLLRHVPSGKRIASLGFGAEKSDAAALVAQLQAPMHPGA